MIIYFVEDDDTLLSDVTCVIPIDNFCCPIKPFGDLSAEDYLEFAHKDLSKGDKQSSVNAFGNAKRSFHYQIERILFALGLREVTKKKFFPQKVEILENLQIIPGALLRTFNKERNLMEHEYLQPTKEQAENSVALSDLLLMATRELLTSLPVLIRVKYKNDKRDLLYRLMPDEGRVHVKEIKGTTLQKSEYGEHYAGNIFNFFAGGDERSLEEGISLVDVAELELELSKTKEEKWMKTTSLFVVPLSKISKERYLTENGMVTISTNIYLPNWKNQLDDIFDKK